MNEAPSWRLHPKTPCARLGGMSLIPPDLSSKLVELSRLLRQSGESTAQINQLRDQLATSGPNVHAAQRLDALHTRSIQLSWDEQKLTAACVRGLEGLLRSVGTSTKRGAAAENGTRGDAARGESGGRAAAASAAAALDGGGGSGSGSAAPPKGKRARVSEPDEKKRPASPSAADFPSSQLETVAGEAAEAPLCGAVPAAADTVVPVGGRVVSRLSGPKVIPQHWAVGIVLRYIAAKSKYVLRDEDPPAGSHGGQPKCASARGREPALPPASPAPRAAGAPRVLTRAPRASPAPCRPPPPRQAAHDHRQIRRAPPHIAARARLAQRAQRLPAGRAGACHVPRRHALRQGHRRGEPRRRGRAEVVCGRV